MSIRELLAPVKTRADAATEGPWEVDRNYPFTSDLVGIFAPGPKHYILQVENLDDLDDPTSDEDIQFLAAARTDVPRLIQALEAVAKVHEPVDALMNPGRHERVVKVCTGCGTDDGNWSLWPCATVRAVVAALGCEA